MKINELSDHMTPTNFERFDHMTSSRWLDLLVLIAEEPQDK